MRSVGSCALRVMGVWGLREIAHGVLLLQAQYQTYLGVPPPGRCVVDCNVDGGEGTAPTKKHECKHHRAGSIGEKFLHAQTT
jgi:hypothetical protein